MRRASLSDSCVDRGIALAGGRPRRLAGIAIVILLAACSQSQSASKNLPLACEINSCDCIEDGAFSRKTQAPSWNPDGSAYCPVNYHLHMAAPPSYRWGS